MYVIELLLFFIHLYCILSLSVAANCSLFILGNNYLYMCYGMMVPSLLASTLYGTITLFMPANVFNFAVITNQFFIKMN